MSVAGMPSKRFKYLIEHNGTTVELDKSPISWDSHEMGYSRSDDFGINVENVASMKFVGNGANILRSIYRTNGIFSTANVIIEKLNDKWKYDFLYNYSIDFETYKEDHTGVEVKGVESGLLKLITANKDTEYEIDIPESGYYLGYTGINYSRKNLIQCLPGDIRKHEFVIEDTYALKGNRSVRAYSDAISFTDNSGVPFETITFRCVKDISFTAKITLKLKVKATQFTLPFQSPPSRGKIRIIKHKKNANNYTYIDNKGIAPYLSKTVQSSTRNDYFDIALDLPLDLVDGDYVSIFYQAESGKSYTKVEVSDCFDTTLEIFLPSLGEYNSQKLQLITYEWLIKQLLDKIAGAGKYNFYSNIKNNDFTPMLSCTQMARRMGAQTFEGTFKAKLSDVLKSYNILHCTGIDISGNTIKICKRADFYTNNKWAEIDAKNINVIHDLSHQYKRINVGYKADSAPLSDAVVYPFNCKKVFEINNSPLESELDLINPFISDPYQIESLIRKVQSEDKADTSNEFFIFAVKQLDVIGERVVNFGAVLGGSQMIGVGSDENSNLYIYEASEQITNEPAIVVSDISPNEYVFINDIGGISFGGESDYYYRIKIYIDAEIENGVLPSYFGLIENSEEFYHLLLNRIIERTDTNYKIYLDIIVSGQINTSFFFRVGNVPDVYFNYFSFLAKEIGVDANLITHTANIDVSSVENHKDYVDDGTIYNLSISPKRILNKHIDYVSISNFMNTEDIKFVNSDIDSNITSKLDYESYPVKENENVQTRGGMMFRPIIIEFETKYNLVPDDKKYGYITIFDEKNNRELTGWLISIATSPTKNKGKKVQLQARTI